jgi:hypothetical protein
VLNRLSKRDPETTQNDKHFCTYWCLEVLRPIISVTPIWRKGLTYKRTHGQWVNALASKQDTLDRRTSQLTLLFICASSRTKSKVFQSTYLPPSTTFYTCIISYKKQGPYWPTSLYYFLYVHHHIQKQRAPYRHIIVFFIHVNHHKWKARGNHIHSSENQVLSKLC